MTTGRSPFSLAWAALALAIVAILGVAAYAAHPPLPGEGCKDAEGHGEVRVAHVFREKPHWSGHDRGQEVMNVSVRFEGTQVWGYLLVRDTSRQPWRIFDEGMG